VDQSHEALSSHPDLPPKLLTPLATTSQGKNTSETYLLLIMLLDLSIGELLLLRHVD
jgi:hypothetical protein